MFNLKHYVIEITCIIKFKIDRECIWQAYDKESTGTLENRTDIARKSWRNISMLFNYDKQYKLLPKKVIT